ncbi:MAG: PHP domain-containing protein [Defluviitaleaceae bacterium]|nr:PHP domain-containing protein [Defluviitaleaceae bacterium]
MPHDTAAMLNAENASDRLAILCKLPKPAPSAGFDVNNHIHTTYSFSPYSPTSAVWHACEAGLSTAGIIDHDTVAGIEEFNEAGKIIGFPTTSGFELRCKTEAVFGSRRTNNTDQIGVTYFTFHGLPHTRIETARIFLRPVAEARALRNRKMTERINGLFDGVSIDYDRDVLPVSQQKNGGSVTERHLLFAFAQKLCGLYGRGSSLVNVLKQKFFVGDDINQKLSDISNPFYLYDLLGFLKAEASEHFYADANEKECPDIRAAAKFANENGIILTYPYLGDVAVSVTADKKKQEYEDSFLDELFEILVNLGIKAFSYMPSRNTREQLIRVRELCGKHQMLQICGEDINGPRQKFICAAMRDKLFSDLYDTTWALIGHEKAATKKIDDAFIYSGGPLKSSVERYKNIAKKE